MSELHFLSVLCPQSPKEHPGAQPPILCLFIPFRETAMEIRAVLVAQACLVPQACQANGEKR